MLWYFQGQGLLNTGSIKSYDSKIEQRKTITRKVEKGLKPELNRKKHERNDFYQKHWKQNDAV